jgi:hypothetical protein
LKATVVPSGRAATSFAASALRTMRVARGCGGSGASFTARAGDAAGIRAA